MTTRKKATKGLFWKNGSLWIDFTTPAGVRHRYSLRTTDARQAERLAASERDRILLEEKGLEESGVTVRSMMTRFIDYARHRRRPKTLQLYEKAFPGFVELAPPLARDVKRADVDRWVTQQLERGLSRTTISIDLNAIRAAFTWAVSQRLLLKHDIPTDTKALGREPQRVINYLERPELEALIESAGAPVAGGQGAARPRVTPIKAMVAVCGYAGLRASEMLHLDAADVDLSRGLLTVRAKPGEGFDTKTHRERVVPMAQALMDILREHGCSARGPLFRTRGGKRYSIGNVTRELRAAAVRADLADKIGCGKGSWNVLRHTFGSLLAQEGVAFLKIAKWMGNSVAIVERHYASLQPERYREDMDRAFGVQPTPDPEQAPSDPPQAEGKIIAFPGWERQTG